MAAQGLHGARGAHTPADTAREEDLERQWGILEEREAELVAKHPDKSIAVCGGEVFVGDTAGEAVSMARAAHPGRPFFLRPCRQASAQLGDPGGAGDAPSADFEEDLARQERIFMDRADELLARHPDKFIAVCGGEVFVGDTDGEAVSMARAAHPGRPFFLRIHDPCFWR